jgi:hypothetical protein
MKRNENVSLLGSYTRSLLYKDDIEKKCYTMREIVTRRSYLFRWPLFLF